METKGILTDNNKLVTLIFLATDNPYNLSQANKSFYKTSRDGFVQVKWLLKHPHALQKWAKYRINLRTVTEKAYIEERKWVVAIGSTDDDHSKVFPEKLLKPEVCLGILKALENYIDQGVLTTWDEGITSETVRAIWSFACLHLFLEIPLRIIETPSLFKFMDRLAWREATYAAVESATDDSQSKLFEVIKKIRPDLAEDVPRVPILAARLGRLQVLKDLLKMKNYDNVDMLLEAVKEATEQGQGKVVEFLLSRVETSDQNRQRMAKQYADMNSLQTAASNGDWAKVDASIAEWKKEGPAHFNTHWHTAVESGCHLGNVELVRKLFAAKGAPRPTVRTLALALAEQHFNVAEVIIDFVPRYTNEVHLANESSSLLRDLPLDQQLAYEQLLSRYCRETDPQIALELADDTAQAVTAESGAIHRKEFVYFLIKTGKIKMDSKSVQEAMWEALVNGRMDVARLLRDGGVPLGWMEPSREKLHGEEEEKTTEIMQPPANFMLMSALGGDWTNVVKGLQAGSGDNIFVSSGELDKFLNSEIEVISSEEKASPRNRDRAKIGALTSAPVIKPRRMVDPNDNFWNAFLSGNSNDVKKFLHGQATPGWMEPSMQPIHRRKTKISNQLKGKEKLAERSEEDLVYDDDETSKLDTWAGVLGLTGGVKDDQMDVNAISMFLGLGGVLPSN